LHADGATIAVVTHDRKIASRMPRKIEMLDGQVVSDTTRPPAPPTAVSSPARRPLSFGDGRDERTAPQ
jgi:ABC-type polar amino acid transport system ATPase subunit